MAEILLATIAFSGNTGTQYQDGDFLYIFYDNEAPLTDQNGIPKTPKVFWNDDEITNGPQLLVGFNRSLGTPNVVSNSFESINYPPIEVKYYSVSTSLNFPYYSFTQTIAPPDPGSIDDVNLSIDSVVKPSTSGSLDGSITVSATGTGTPFIYGIRLSDGSITKESNYGSFQNLPSGDYTFIVTDYNGHTDTVSVTLNVQLDSPELRWFAEYRDNFQTDGGLYRLEISEVGFSGVSSEVIVNAGSTGSVNYRGESKEYFNTFVLPSNVSLKLEATQESQFKDLLYADEKQFTLKKYYEGDLVWQGYFNPSSYSDVLYSLPYSVNLVFSDRLADLKDYDFTYTDEYNTETGEGLISGNISQIEAIRLCLSKIDLGFGMRIGINLFAEEHNIVNTTPLHQTYFDASMYFQDSKVSDCYTVIKDILTMYQAMIYSEAGFWYIIRKQEYLNFFNSIYSLPTSEQVDPPTNLTATTIDSETIRLTWTEPLDISNTSVINIEESTDGLSWTTRDSVTPTSDSYDVDSLTPSTTYYFRLIAIAISPYTNSDYTSVVSSETNSNPLSLFGSNLHAWFSADDVILSGGTSVSQLNDKSGNSRHLTQATASFQPSQIDGTGNFSGSKLIDGDFDDLISNDTNWMGLGTDPYFVVAIVENSFPSSGTSLPQFYGIKNATVNTRQHSISASSAAEGYVIIPNWSSRCDYKGPAKQVGLSTDALMGTFRGSNGRIWTNGDEAVLTLDNENTVTQSFDSIEFGQQWRQKDMTWSEIMFIKGDPEDYGLANGNAINDLHTGYLPDRYTGLTIVSPNIP